VKVLAVAFALVFGAVPIATPIRVVDGDTVKWRGESVRLLGIDAPELSKPKCLKELGLAKIAKDELTKLLDPANNSSLRFTKKRDKWGRKLVYAYSNHEPVAEIMIARGLAVAYFGRGPRKDWCTR
jgi:endonuclease YncB( thermonuclease family)